MSTQPFVSSRYRAFDANGDPLAGGKLYTYSAGTSTPLSTYTTRAGSVANANPVVLDANGEADVWLSPGVAYKFVLADSADVIQSTVDNWPTASESAASTEAAAVEPGGRLTLTSGTPVTTADVTSSSTVYYVPYKHPTVPLYDGTSWALYSVGSGLSQTTSDTTKSPAAVANSSNYDMFIWNDAGTVRLSRGPAWSSATTRGTGAGTTELEQVNGRHVNKVSITNGPGAQRGLYVGTVRSNGSAQIADSKAVRFVWNMHNRARRFARVHGGASAYIYNTNTWRQANASSANQFDFVIGLSEDAVSARVIHHVSVNSGDGAGSTAIGLDSTSAFATDCMVGTSYVPYVPALGAIAEVHASWDGFPGIGYHYLAWLEYGNHDGAGNTFFSHTTAYLQSGIMGVMMA